MDLGRKGYAELIRRNVQFAKRVAAWMATSGLYEVQNLDKTGDVPLNVVLFRAMGDNDGTGAARLAQAINATRLMYVSPGKGAVRLAVSNWMTGLGDDDEDFVIVRKVLEEVAKA